MNKVFSQLGEKIRFFDGAMGTVLQEKGLYRENCRSSGTSPTGRN